MAAPMQMKHLRDRIFSDLSWTETDHGTGLFGSPIFSPLTEISVFLLRLHQRAQGQILGPGPFRMALLGLLTAPDPGVWAANIWPDLAPEAQARLRARVAGLTGLPEALCHLVLSRDELGTLPAADIVALLYRFFLNRAPDPAGLAQWVLMLEQGMAVEDAAAAFAASDEAQASGTGRSLTVIDAQPAAQGAVLGAVLASYRRLQDMELARLYDFARLVALMDDMASEGAL